MFNISLFFFKALNFGFFYTIETSNGIASTQMCKKF